MNKIMLEKEIFQLIKQYGSQEHLANQLSIHQSVISRVLDGGAISMDLALSIEEQSKGSIPAECLVEVTKKYDRPALIKKMKHRAQQAVIKQPLFTINLPLMAIETERWPLYHIHSQTDKVESNRPLLLDADRQLLWGIDVLHTLHAAGKKTATVL